MLHILTNTWCCILISAFSVAVTVVSHCDYNSHFSVPDDVEDFLCVYLHSCIFFCDVYVFVHFNCFFYYWVTGVFKIYFEYIKFLSKICVSKYFLPFCSLVIHFFNGSFDEQKLFFLKSNLLNTPFMVNPLHPV